MSLNKTIQSENVSYTDQNSQRAAKLSFGTYIRVHVVFSSKRYVNIIIDALDTRTEVHK